MLECFTDPVEEHNADRLPKLADTESTDGRDAHQKVFIHHMAGLHVFQGC